jgi:hypothetical protein
MRLGQTSIIHFSSRLVASVVGFLATLYFARELGAGTLGFYFVALAIVSWLSLAGTLGVILLGVTAAGVFAAPVLILVFAFIANPTAVHALARAARALDEDEGYHTEEPT